MRLVEFMLLMIVLSILLPKHITASYHSPFEGCKPTSKAYLTLPKENEYSWIYAGFTSFFDLESFCDVHTYPTFSYEKTKNHVSVYFFPGQEIIVGLRAIELDAYYGFINYGLTIVIADIIGFDASGRSAFLLDWFWGDFSFIWQRFHLDLYLEGSIVDETTCDAEILERLDLQTFASLSNAILYLNPTTNFKRPICPYIFRNASIYDIEINGIVNTALVKNYMHFYEIKNEKNITINLLSNLKRVYLAAIYKVPIDHLLLHKLVFKELTQLILEGSVNYIYPDLFKAFSKLKTLNIDLYNLRELFHSADNSWMAGLYYYGQSISNMTEYLSKNNLTYDQLFSFTMIDYQGLYEYPDEDLCLFKNYPLDKLILIKLESISLQGAVVKLNLDSCSLNYVLHTNYELSLKYGYIRSQYPVPDQLQYEACNLEQALNICFAGTFEATGKAKDFNYYDLAYYLQWGELIGPIITLPIVSSLGFILNLLSILIITNKKLNKERLFEQKIFKYILMNSVFNCLECFLVTFRILNECMGVNSVFCSKAIHYAGVKYFRVIVTGYLSEIFKTCSMLTTLFFSLERYIQASKSENEYLKKFSNANTNKLLLGGIIFSGITSLIIVFNFELNSHVDSNYDMPPQFVFESVYEQTQLLAVFYFIHYFINDLVLFLINLFIDFLLIIIIKINLKKKLKNRRKFLIQVMSPNSTLEEENANKYNKDKYKAEVKACKSTEEKANLMIIATMFVHFFCRLPELGGSFFFYFFTIYQHNGYLSECEFLNACYLIFNLIEYAYMISYVTNFFFYYKFNKNFALGLRMFLGLRIDEAAID